MDREGSHPETWRSAIHGHLAGLDDAQRVQACCQALRARAPQPFEVLGKASVTLLMHTWAMLVPRKYQLRQRGTFSYPACAQQFNSGGSRGRLAILQSYESWFYELHLDQSISSELFDPIRQMNALL